MHRATHRRILINVIAAVAVASGCSAVVAEGPRVPARVLITNDNGIDDPKIVALALAFAAAHAETWVVAPAGDKSGSGSYLSLPRGGPVRVVSHDLGPGIVAFTVDGFPGDCVVLALAALMKDQLPELVVSGINGGPNLGADWMFSGTVGAARVAALAGLPAIAVSGLDDDLPGAVDAAVEWVVRLAAHPVVRGLEPGHYLTVSLPRRPPAEIQGVRVVDRAPLRRMPRLAYDAGTSAWRLVGMDERPPEVSGAFDEVAYEDGMIAVVPMHADEVDGDRLRRWLRSDPGLPAWRHAGGAEGAAER